MWHYDVQLYLRPSPAASLTAVELEPARTAGKEHMCTLHGAVWRAECGVRCKIAL